MNGKVVLITGASSGIGRSTAEKFLNKGYIVYGAARTEAEMRNNCVQEILTAEGKFDILINNAGYGSFGAVEEVPLAEAKRQFEVNLFGLSELTKLVIPGMREN